MAHFCKLGVGNKVLKVIAVSNDVATSEQADIDFLNNIYKTNDVWKQTSYNNNFRKQYAGIGMRYDASKNKFISPQPYTSWSLNETTCRWEAPIAYPDDGKEYTWNETLYQSDNTKGWEEV
jgi:hypothetical protein